MSVRVKLEMSECIVDDVSQLQEENWRLKNIIDDMRVWLQNIPSEWTKYEAEIRNLGETQENLYPGGRIDQDSSMLLEDPGVIGDSQNLMSPEHEHDTPGVIENRYMEQDTPEPNDHIQQQLRLHSPIQNNGGGISHELEQVTSILIEDPRELIDQETGTRGLTEDPLKQNDLKIKLEKPKNKPLKKEIFVRDQWNLMETPVVSNKRAESSPPRPRPDTQEGELPLEYDKCEGLQSFKASVSKKRKLESLKCDECDFLANSKSVLRHHIRVKHLGIRYQCDQCNFASTTTNNLKKHRQSIHEGIKYPCDQCVYSATVSSHLTRHVKAMHNENKTLYPCDQCKFKSTSEGNLMQHKHRKHGDVFYHCESCDYSSLSKGDLKRHMKKHEKGGARFPCDECDLEFAVVETLRQHKENIHLVHTIEFH